MDARAKRRAAKADRMEKFARALAQARQARGLTQGALAELVDVTQSAVSGWEACKYLPDDPVDVFDLETALKVPRGYLSQHLGYGPLTVRRDPPVDLEVAIEASPLLGKIEKSALAGLYRQFIASHAP